MMQEERLRQIRKWVEQENSIQIGELQERLRVSAMTIWRDLRHLEGSGVIRRVWGGAVKVKADADEPLFEIKENVYNSQKDVIAQYAAGHFVAESEIIILEGGTTVAHMVPFLLQPNLTMITNGLNTLARAKVLLRQSSVICCGGLLRDRSHTFVGPQAEDFFAGIRAHTLFLCATGITLEDGITDPSQLEIQVKRAMHKSAERTILLMDSSKFGLRSLTQIIPLAEIDSLVTDPGAPQDVLDELGAQGLKIQIAGPAM
jgi:DeoR/GlpR family transcriptional regulator of sugar metabolism